MPGTRHQIGQCKPLDRPMRTFVEPAVFNSHFAAEKSRFVVFYREGVDIFADQEKTALSGVDVRIDAIEKILIDDDRTDRLGRMRLTINIDGVDGRVPRQR